MFRWIWVAVLCVASIGCPSKEQLGFGAINVLSEGVINDPANKTLRFDLLKYGLAQFCKEMQQRGVGLKLRDDAPTIGRFFATSCQSRLIDEEQRKTIVVRYAGRGYGWTNLSYRVGFETQGLIEYAPDFRVQGDAMYVYFRPRNVDSISFRTTLVESSLANTGIALTGVQPDQLGQNIVLSQLRRGFTVIRYSDLGETDFGMGVVATGERPFRPFQVVESERTTLENDRTEVHSGQQDYIGGFDVTEDDQALYLTMTLEGSPAVDVMLLNKLRGDGFIQRYTTQAGPVNPGSVPFWEVLRTGQGFRRFIPVPQGSYYFLIDNSRAVGRAVPPGATGEDRPARVDYLVQVGDRP